MALGLHSVQLKEDSVQLKEDSVQLKEDNEPLAHGLRRSPRFERSINKIGKIGESLRKNRRNQGTRQAERAFQKPAKRSKQKSTNRNQKNQPPTTTISTPRYRLAADFLSGFRININFLCFSEKTCDLGNVIFTQFFPFTTKAFSHFLPHVAGINQLHFPFTVFRFAIGHNPNVSADARVVEHVGWQPDDCFE